MGTIKCLLLLDKKKYLSKFKNMIVGIVNDFYIYDILLIYHYYYF